MNERPRRRRRRLLWSAQLAVGGALLLVVVGGLLAIRRPAYFQPALVNRATLTQDKQDLVNVLDGIGAGLNRGQSVDVELVADQVNRWIAGRFEMWPEQSDLRLDPLRFPQVEFLDGDRIRASALVREDDGWGVILTLEVRVRAAGEFLEIDVHAARVGELPAPASWLLEEVERLARREGLPVRRRPGGLLVPNRFVWPNGKRPFEVSAVAADNGRLKIRLTPR